MSGVCSCSGPFQGGNGSSPVTDAPPIPTISYVGDYENFSQNWEASGTSGYLAIGGKYLTANGESPTPTISLHPTYNGVADPNVTLEFSSATETDETGDVQVNLSYTIGAGAQVGTHQLSLQTASGTANGTFSVSCGTPVNLVQSGPGVDLGGGSGTLQFHYTWSSSTGRLPDLQSCFIGETVLYPGGYPSYSPPKPFSGSFPNPTSSGVTANLGAFQDTHSLPGPILKPYSSEIFTAAQTYYYTCPCHSNNAEVDLVTGLDIVRNVTNQFSAPWYFFVDKQNISPLTGLSYAYIQPLP